MKPLLYFHPSYPEAVAQYSAHFQLSPSADVPRSVAGHALWFDGDHLQLLAAADKGKGLSSVSVNPLDITRRASQPSLLARACDVRPGQTVRIMDAMAGWGVDGLELQLRGACVLQIERHAVAWALLVDLRRRFGLSSCDAAWADLNAGIGLDNLFNPPAASYPTDAPAAVHGGSALLADAAWALEPDHGLRVDVVYLDPMFEARKKSALPNKRLQQLAAIVEGSQSSGTKLDETTLAQWVQLAQRCAKGRVVVKRRLKDAALQPAPAWQYRGKAVRYDCYVGQAS